MEKGSNPSSRWNFKLLIAVVFIGYLVFGFSENIKGPAIPRMQGDFGLNEMQIGLLLALNALGYLLACSFTGILVKRIGLRAANIIAFVTMFLGGIFIYLSISYSTLSAAYFLMYVGNGILEITLGILAARVFTKNTGWMMNLSHFFYGLASTVAPIFATGLMSLTVSGRMLGWQPMYLIMLSSVLIPLIIAVVSKFPGDGAKHEEKLSVRQYSKDSAAWLIVLILSLGVTAELSVGGWLVNFLEQAYKWDMERASAMLSGFFFTFMLARLLLGPLTDKIGFTRSLIIFSGFAGVLTIAGIVIGEKGAFLFALAGAGIAPIYPTVMALLSKRYPRDTDTAISFTVTLMGIGSVIGNFLVGIIIDMIQGLFTGSHGAKEATLIGFKAGYAFIGVCALACSMTSVALYRLLKRRMELL
ncbi:MAG: MFS transporter [Bacillota bacterium]|nr:MFS transporter [Bacillota bacterium]